MAEAMDDIKEYEYIAIFDADFHPEPDFLLKCIPYLRDNSDVGFVQARWTYANGNESILTRVQEISLSYHIKCEQYARFATGAFFNFNGTAGIWRRATIEKAGGWNARTTVEDMDLSLRAYLQGWRFVFLYDVTCLNELPSSYDAYRKQQHRWSCGPMQLWRKATSAVWASNISWAQKLYLVRPCRAAMSPPAFLPPRTDLVPAWRLLEHLLLRHSHVCHPHRVLHALLHHRADGRHRAGGPHSFLGACVRAGCHHRFNCFLLPGRLEAHGCVRAVRERHVCG